MFISSDLPLTRRISLFPNLEYYSRLLLPYILDINYLDSSAILGSYTTIPLYSSLYYRLVFLTKTFLSILEIYANISFVLYAIYIY